MRNPCDDCIIKVNCTAICFQKHNYKQLILHAMLIGHSWKYMNMLKDTNEQEANIINRAQVALSPN